MIKFLMNRKRDENEDHYHGMIANSYSEQQGLVKEARASGISWVTILQLILQYGPQAFAILQQLLDALRTPVPEPTPAATK